MSGSPCTLRVSVVIPSYNAGTTIAACLDAVLTQQTAEAYEVIVVDSSADGTADVVVAHYPAVQLYRTDRRLFPGEARNLGIARARGDIILFTDADCVPAADWLQRHLDGHAQGHRVVGGGVANGHPYHLVSIAEHFLEFREYTPWLPPGTVRMSPACNLSVAREVFAAAGVFPPLRAGEDVLLAAQVAAAGYRIYFEPGACVRHGNRRTLGPFLRNQRVLGEGFTRSRRQAALPGRWLIESPPRLVLAVPIRLLRSLDFVLAEQFPRNLGSLALFVLTLPIQLAGLVAWTLGAAAVLRRPDAGTGELERDA